MAPPPIPPALERALTSAREIGVFVRDRGATLGSSAMRALGKLRGEASPHSLEQLAQGQVRVEHPFMGKADIDAVLERRSEIAREVAALEAMRAEMEAEDQELRVAERVLRRLTETPAAPAPRRAEVPAAASNEG